MRPRKAALFSRPARVGRGAARPRACVTQHVTTHRCVCFVREYSYHRSRFHILSSEIGGLTIDQWCLEKRATCHTFACAFGANRTPRSSFTPSQSLCVSKFTTEMFTKLDRVSLPLRKASAKEASASPAPTTTARRFGDLPAVRILTEAPVPLSGIRGLFESSNLRDAVSACVLRSHCSRSLSKYRIHTRHSRERET